MYGQLTRFRIVTNVVSERLRRKKVRDVHAFVTAAGAALVTPGSHERGYTHAEIADRAHPAALHAQRLRAAGEGARPVARGGRYRLRGRAMPYEAILLINVRREMPSSSAARL